MGTPYAGVHGIGLVARDEIRGRDSPLTNRTSDVPRPLRRSTWRGAPARERGEQGVPAGSQRSDRSSAASHPAPCQSVRPRSRSIRSRKPSKYVHSSAATSLAARGRPGPAFTISCCWREASHASRAAAILFPSDMAVSLGFCRYSPCLRMCHRMARPQGCVDHAVCLQPQTARQPLRCFFLCFVVQEDLRLPDSGTYAGVHGIGLVARDEIRGRDSPLTNRTSDVPRAASSIYLERRTVGPAR
jgi:hypothetical protein